MTSTGQGILGHNMFTYCGNNPVHRNDTEGESWVAVLGAIGAQYVADVIGNIAQGKTGVEVFYPTSSITDYCSAAITALIPGGSLGSALVRSVVSEAILWMDNTLNGKSNENNLGESCWNVIGNTIVDFGMGKLLDNTLGTYGSEDIATYSNRSRSSSGGRTLQETYNALQRSNAIKQTISGLALKIYDVATAYCS